MVRSYGLFLAVSTNESKVVGGAASLPVAPQAPSNNVVVNDDRPSMNSRGSSGSISAPSNPPTREVPSSMQAPPLTASAQASGNIADQVSSSAAQKNQHIINALNSSTMVCSEWTYKVVGWRFAVQEFDSLIKLSNM
jgi:hypothetical protein